MCYGGVYSKAQGTSPWDVFSMIHAGNFKLNGYLIGLVILVLLIVGMCLEGKNFSAEISADGSRILTGSGVTDNLHFTETGNPAFQKCSACSRKCPANIGLPTDGSWKVERRLIFSARNV